MRLKPATKVTVPSFAKLNLDLRVLYRRPDGFHELRTIFQTIDLHDTLDIEFRSSKRIELDIDSSVEIEDNIVLRAARAVLEYLDMGASVRFRLQKRIPMGGGLGGGSSNAAAVLIALPALARKRIEPQELQRLASWLGSDVPFFLYGGTSVAFGRGTELYPLPDLPAHPVLILPTGIHVSTGEAYSALGRGLVEPDADASVTDALTSPDGSPILGEFQAVAWSINHRPLSEVPLQNEFEPVVFAQHPELSVLLRKLKRSGASVARMTGSGSSLFGVFPGVAEVRGAAGKLPGSIPARFLPRATYAKRWRQALGEAAPSSTLF